MRENHWADVYLERIGAGRPARADAEALRELHMTGLELIGHDGFFAALSRDFARYTDKPAHDRPTTAAAMALKLGRVRPAAVLDSVVQVVWIVDSPIDWFKRLLALSRMTVEKVVALVRTVKTAPPPIRLPGPVLRLSAHALHARRDTLISRGWTPHWAEARSTATALVRQGDTQPLSDFITAR
ncbi:hypothetical protein OG909_08870 [Streptomyces sp. NBC_01754]|uniref:hypothetical protein n=1 Tax=Streptomyces sp. NBC_01754 TaxID=2975930 RepID=UPI002DDBFA8B|nr:hypothetical protein [Streptomyces sp. NBC_01754]WSC92398.1 hypothetical protein OG909_08870 [Streptomyces sp. NBC_01754]